MSRSRSASRRCIVGDSARTIGALSGVSELDLSQMGMQFTTSYAIHPKINLKSRMEEYGWTVGRFRQAGGEEFLQRLAQPAGPASPAAEHRAGRAVARRRRSAHATDVRVHLRRRRRGRRLLGRHRQDAFPARRRSASRAACCNRASIACPTTTGPIRRPPAPRPPTRKPASGRKISRPSSCTTPWPRPS